MCPTLSLGVIDVITWESRGSAASSRHRRYTVATGDFPLTEWATDELSQVYENVEDFMYQAQQEARENVMAASRVDTGYMRANVESTVAKPGEEIVLEFGWWEGNPHYAPYQEFGTRFIEPMLAVHTEFLRVSSELPWSVKP